ncbi:C3orf30.2 family protein [Megaselia abdita]
MEPPHGDPARLKEALDRDPKSGPRPLTIEEYRRRCQQKTPNPGQQTSSPVSRQQPNQVAKKRGGKKVKQRRKLGELYCLAAIAVTRDEKRHFIKQIQEIRKNGMV